MGKRLDVTSDVRSFVAREGRMTSGNVGKSRVFCEDLAERDWETLKTAMEISDQLTTANVCLFSFWDKVAPKITGHLSERFGASVAEMTSLMSHFARIDLHHAELASRLVNHLSTREEIQLSPIEELVLVLESFAKATESLRPQKLLNEIALRVVEEIGNFSVEELLAILHAYSHLQVVHPLMLRTIAKQLHFTDDAFLALSETEIAAIAETYGRLRFRHDTFMKTAVSSRALGHTDDWDFRGLSILQWSMQKLKMTSEDTRWWAKRKDFAALLAAIKQKEAAEPAISIASLLSVRDCAYGASALAAARVADVAVFARLLRRVRLLLEADIRQGRQLGFFLTELAGMPVPESAKKRVQLEWMCSWLCEHVMTLEVRTVAQCCRALAQLGVNDHNFFKVFVPYFTERSRELAKSDIRNVKDTFNQLKLYDRKIGRDLFFALGRRFQDLQREAGTDAENEAAVSTEARPPPRLLRLG